MSRHCLSVVGREAWGGSGGGGQWLWQTQSVHWLFHVRRLDRARWYWLCSLSLFCLPPFLFSFPRSPPSPFLFPIVPPFSLSPSSHYRWRGQLHGPTGVSGGQRGPPHHPHQRFRHQPKVSFIPPRPSVPSAFCLSLFPSRWGMSCLAPGKVAVRRKHTHTHSQARTLSQTASATRSHRMSDDSPHRRRDWQLRQLKRCNQRPLAPCPLHPSLLLGSFHPAISQLVAVIPAASYFLPLRLADRREENEKEREQKKREGEG